MITPDWSKEFELMCDASDYAVGAVLGQRQDKTFHVIYYASKVLNEAQMSYATTEKRDASHCLCLRKIMAILSGVKGGDLH